jgi:hypothetical protein
MSSSASAASVGVPPDLTVAATDRGALLAALVP